MNNKQIAGRFDLLAKLMELHDENPFKIRSYANAYVSLRKLEGDLMTMGKEHIAAIPGVGSAIADKIEELLSTGEMKTLKKYQDITPSGIQEMLSVKGLGPKKVKQIWKEMEIHSIGELLYACNENRLMSYKGFGSKLQEEIKDRIEYFIESKGKYLYAHLHKHADDLVTWLKASYPGQLFSLSGDIKRMMPEVKGIEILATIQIEADILSDQSFVYNDEKACYTFNGFPVYIEVVTKESFYWELFKRSCSESFLSYFEANNTYFESESAIFKKAGVHFIPAEFRENIDTITLYKKGQVPRLIEVTDIKGIVHNHSTYSDGLHSLEEMAEYVRKCGFEYFVISDHSKSAGYAGGLSEEKVLNQIREIETLNAKYGDGFKIFKSIESDILIDGSLDYREEILKQFDFVIASVHSVLNMDETKATSRLIKAIENPYTRILGHPTGRLLLARPGYPVDFKKIIDACASNGVVIELNANPQRLDIDWTLLPYAMEKNVLIAINPDAHSKESIHYINYGVAAGRKGGLTKEMCLNTKNLKEFKEWVKS
ncbi:MAG: DNA polymerase/3'-5' exonuclease PolX [Saprospiraceae bacterium]|nr:DNA polymerase/3'-5' exonuclease PolX [Saprospiraceae bacterium]